jgi:AraC family transcriptional regulator
MNWQERMEAAVDYLELNLEREIDYGRAASKANCSTFHFLRMFAVVTGVTAGEYVRRRRLSHAALELAGGDAKVIDLALRFGYESPDAFAKAFKREFGITPSEARSGGVGLRTWPRLAFSVVLKGDVPMDYRIEKRGEIALTGLPLRTTMDDGLNLKEIPAFWTKCNGNGTVEALVRAMPADTKLGIMGVCMNDFDEKTRSFSYLVGIEKPDDVSRASLPKGCVDVVASASTWAVFPSHGPMPNAIQEVWKRIYAEWFPSSGYEHAGGPELEVYGPGDSQAADYYSEVWIPVKKAGK